MKAKKYLGLAVVAAILLMTCGCQKAEVSDKMALPEDWEERDVEYTVYSPFLLLLSEQTQTMADGTTWRYVYYYDRSGVLTAADFSRNDEPPYTIVFECDENGSILRETLRKSAKRSEVTEYEYLDSGELAVKTMTADGSPVIRTEYDYDAHGRETERRVYSDGELTGRYVQEFSEDGLRSTVTEYDAAEQKGYSQRIFADTGALLEEVHYDPEDALIRKTEYSYDDMGNLIASVTTDGGGAVEYEYQYIYSTFDRDAGMFKMEG